MTLEGVQIGHYQLRRFIGSGAMGEVYLAEDTRINRQVAIKIMRKEASPGLYPGAQASEDALRLFHREMKAITALDHPNILPLFDFGEQVINQITYAYMVMPFRPEGSLVDWLQKRNSPEPLAPQEVVQIIQQAADALQHAHNRHLIHLDVKPSNFLLRLSEDSLARRDVLLSDFGIARFTSATSTASQTVRGTPPYMAPEQWTGSPTPATDQYALAIMAYQLLTGRFPFEGNMQQVMYKHLQERPQPPSTFNPRIPPDMDSVILKALEKRSEDRFPSIQAFSAAFAQAWQLDETYISSSSLPTERATPVSASFPPTQYATPVSPYPTLNTAGIPPTHYDSIPPPPPSFSQHAYPPKKPGISWLIAIIGLIVLLVGGFAFALSLSKNSGTSAPSSSSASTQPSSASTTSPSLTTGSWQGQGTYNNGQSSFNMLLTITTINGNTFSGTLTEDTYTSEVAITGNITGRSSTEVDILFTDPSAISGNSIQLGCTYIATVSSGRMQGVWKYPGDSSPDGTILLNKTA